MDCDGRQDVGVFLKSYLAERVQARKCWGGEITGVPLTFQTAAGRRCGMTRMHGCWKLDVHITEGGGS